MMLFKVDIPLNNATFWKVLAIPEPRLRGYLLSMESLK